MPILSRATIAPHKIELLYHRKWALFRSSITHIDGNPDVGDWIILQDTDGIPCAYGFYEGGDGAYPYIQIISFAPPHNMADIEQEGMLLIAQRITAAFEIRRRLLLFDPPLTDSYRLCHSQGDALPGLSIDIYGATALLQVQSAGFYRLRFQIAKHLLAIPSLGVVSVFDRSGSSLSPSALSLFEEEGFLSDNQFSEQVASENGIRFLPDWQHSSRLQWTFERRDVRACVGRFAPHKRVLDLHASIGGYSLSAIKAGATSVTSVDHSPRAIERCCYHLALNELDSSNHTSYVGDAFEFIEQSPPCAYDFIVLDPPAFAQGATPQRKALKAYKRINRLAIEKIAPKGLLLTICSSRSIDQADFIRLVGEIALVAQRRVSLISTLSPSPDFPRPISAPDSGEFFKGLLLVVE